MNITELLETRLNLERVNSTKRESKSFSTDQQNNVVSINFGDARVNSLEILHSYSNQLQHLIALNLSGNNIQETFQLPPLERLEVLDVSNNRIKDIAPLKGLKKLSFLNLSNNQFTDLESLKGLLNLKSLFLNGNSVANLTPLSTLINLSDLNLSRCSLIDITPINNLHKIEELDLSDNNIEDLTCLKELPDLKTLDLNANRISNLKGLENLNKLTRLILLENQISDLNALENLINLSTLNLGKNNITNISPLKKLTKLTTLWLIGNTLKDVSIIKHLRKIKYLSLGKTGVTNLSIVNDLTDLVRLDLQENNISDIYPLKDLVNLEELSLEENQIKDITPLRGLKNLKQLDLQSNPITELPPWIINFKLRIKWDEFGRRNGYITLFNNPLRTPTVDIVKQGKSAIVRYFKRIEEQGIDFIYEAKLILVGEGSAGKTSLKIRLINPKGMLPKNDQRTRGIKIYDWIFKIVKANNQVAHIWDFGGQDVYYPVHRFFLTENSVFVLLASSRQTHHNFDYWIPTIYQFGGKSPIVLGQTCHDGNKVPWNDLGYYLGNANFNIIKTQALPYYELNLLKRNEGLNKLRETIVNQIVNLPHFGKGVPRSWVAVRRAIGTKARKHPCISFDVFKEICQKTSTDAFGKLLDIEDCAKFLHSIGVILWYYDNDDLRSWIILQPEWAMNAVYKIIDDEEIQKRRGNILAKDFVRLWKGGSYENKHIILKKMLEVFKIAFQKKHKKEEYIIPARLLSVPVESKWDNNIPSLRLEYKYEFMPKGVVNQVSAELSRYITSSKEVWNNAVNFSNDDNTAQCQVEEDFYNRRIYIKAQGRDARGLIMIVMNALKDVTEEYKGVIPEIVVPCTCDKCVKSNKPTAFLYNDLLRWSALQESATVFCNEGRQSLLIDDLLYNVGLPNINREKKEVEISKTIKLFLASSSELKDDREQFEIFINRENKRLNKKGIFIELELWEDFIDAMSETRLQNEYNKVILDCDIFVSLFFSKVGKFTLEEFEKAFGQFKVSGKPLVYTYFKDGITTMGQIKKEDINSRIDFEEKLKSLGHFPTAYTNIDDLKYKFKMQLETLVSTI
jgi:internalin A